MSSWFLNLLGYADPPAPLHTSPPPAIRHPPDEMVIPNISGVENKLQTWCRLNNNIIPNSTRWSKFKN